MPPGAEAGNRVAARPTAIIIGGSGGIGGACVARFRSAGWRVGFTYDRGKSRARALQSPLGGGVSGAGVSAWDLDIAQEASRRRFLARVERDFAPIDALAFCHGIIVGKRLEDQSPSEIDRAIQVNLSGILALAGRSLPLMAPGSSITLLASSAAFTGSYDPVYAACKGAMVSLAKSLARAWGPRIRVNTVAPGLTENTTVFRGMAPAVRQRHREASVLKEFEAPEDIAEAIFFVSSSAARRISGATIDVNGGEYLR